jgi:hypothetical protein
MTIIFIGGCLLLGVVAFAVQFVLPIYLLYKIVRFLMRKFGGAGPEPKEAVSEGLKQALERSRQEKPAAEAQSELPSQARQEVYVKLKKEGRLDRLALVYYVEDALKAGMTPELVAAALRAKGWPEAEIAAVLPPAA